MAMHIRIIENDEVIGNLWLDESGHVAHDNSIATHNMLDHHKRRHGLGPEHGQQLLEAIEHTLDRHQSIRTERH